MSEYKIKKVSAYPIPVQLGSQEGRIVKLQPAGCLVETAQPLKVHQNYSTQFVLPVLNHVIQFSGVVVKTYDQFRGGLGETAANLKLSEISFKKINPGADDHIRFFLKRIGQAK